MNRSPGKFAAALAVAAAFGASAPAPAAALHGRAPIRVVAAKSCSSGYKRGVINGVVKCLRRGEFCTHSADRQYRRYGFRCTHYDGRVGRYRLT
ncbi:MAG: hypothetical protein ACXVH3_32355 [Solirubrobacteraceae bacterium]